MVDGDAGTATRFLVKNNKTMIEIIYYNLREKAEVKDEAEMTRLYIHR